MSNTIALIPARGGSKLIPRKNIRRLGEHPLIAYSIGVARACRLIDRVIVSTDDPEIALISRAYGAETPFRRPDELAQDQTPDLPVFEHALRWLQEQEGYNPELVVHLRPTCPFRTLALVEEGIRRIAQTPEADSARAVCVPPQSPYKMWTVHGDGWMKPVLTLPNVPESYNLPRQALPIVHCHTGYLDIVRARTLQEKYSMTGKHILPIIMDESAYVDIDNEVEWMFAEYLLQIGYITLARLGFEASARPLGDRQPDSEAWR